MNRILLIVALEEEFRNLPRNFPGKIAYSGVGKINASHTTTRSEEHTSELQSH